MSDEKQIVEVSAWDQLNDAVTFTVEIERPGGSVLRVRMRELSYTDWIQVEIDNPLPSPPIIAGKGGSKQYDRENPDYLRKLGESLETMAYKRLLKALVVDVPGETEEDQLVELRKMPAPILRALRTQVETMHMANQARIEDRAGGFQSSADIDTEDM